jgi:hypothetical protein
VSGDTPEKTKHIKRQENIQEILYIQNTHTHLTIEARSFFDGDVKSLQGMNTSSLTAYLYGAKILTQSSTNLPGIFRKTQTIQELQPSFNNGHKL